MSKEKSALEVLLASNAAPADISELDEAQLLAKSIRFLQQTLLDDALANYYAFIHSPHHAERDLAEQVPTALAEAPKLLHR